MTAARFEPPLSADDPRVSAWLDGHLPETEAAQVARLVAASPELTRLVADLRRQKATLTALPASPPPAGFVQDVLAALDAVGDPADDDAEVEAEWRRIERERLEEEIAEAHEDAAEPVDEPMRRRWPWLALVGALAAGVLTAVVINRPGGRGDREVALVDGPGAESLAQKRVKDGPEDRPAAPARDEKVTDMWLAEADASDKKRKAESQSAERESLTRSLATSADGEKFVANGVEAGKQASMPNAKPGASYGDMAKTDAVAVPADGALQVPAEHRNQAGRPLGRPPTEGAGGAGQPAAPGALAKARALAAPESEFGAGVRTVTYRVRTAADRKRLADLLAASRGENERARRLADEGVAQTLAGEKVPLAAARDRGGPAGERIEISGPPGMIADLVAALEAGPEAESEAARKRAARVPGDPLAADKGAEAADAVVLVIEIVDESAAGSAEAKP